jgi:hypothetical protein
MLSNDNKNRSKIKWPKAIHSDKEQDIFANEQDKAPTYTFDLPNSGCMHR